MTVIDTSRIDDYDHGELAESAMEIIKHLGGSQAWEILEKLCTLFGESNDAIIVASRFDPDNPDGINTIAACPNPPDFESFSAKNAMLVARATLMLNHVMVESGKEVGLGPRGAIELVNKTILKMSTHEQG